MHLWGNSTRQHIIHLTFSASFYCPIYCAFLVAGPTNEQVHTPINRALRQTPHLLRRHPVFKNQHKQLMIFSIRTHPPTLTNNAATRRTKPPHKPQPAQLAEPAQTMQVARLAQLTMLIELAELAELAGLMTFRHKCQNPLPSAPQLT